MSNISLNPPDLIKRGKWIDYRDPIWGDSYNWSWNRSTNDVKQVVFHHSVTKHEATPDDIALLHMARGWGGIGYHFVITKDGTVYYVGDIGTARANVLNQNEKVIGVNMVGDFTKHLPSDEQIISAHELAKHLLFDLDSYPHLKDWGQLVGHKDLQATQCPGSSWPDDMRQRIIDKRPYTPDVSDPATPPDDEPDYRTLYNQEKEDFEKYKTLNDPKVELYNFAVGELNTTMEEFKLALGEVLDESGKARKLFNAGMPLLLKDDEDQLLYPDQLDVWLERMKEQVEKPDVLAPKPPKPVEPPKEPIDPLVKRLTDFLESLLKKILNKISVK